MRAHHGLREVRHTDGEEGVNGSTPFDSETGLHEERGVPGPESPLPRLVRASRTRGGLLPQYRHRGAVPPRARGRGGRQFLLRCLATAPQPPLQSAVHGLYCFYARELKFTRGPSFLHGACCVVYLCLLFCLFPLFVLVVFVLFVFHFLQFF